MWLIVFLLGIMPLTNPPLVAVIGGNTDGATASVSSGTMTLAGGANITLSQAGNVISIRGAAGGGGGTFSAGMSTGGNTSGTSGTVSDRMVFVGGNNVTLSQSVNAGSATLTISAFNQSVQPLGTQTVGMSNLGNTSGTTGVATGTGIQFILAGGNNVTLSQSLNGSSGTVTISAFNQTIQTQNLIAATLAGNTSGALALVSSGTMTLAGGNNITLSQAGNAITISAANPAAGAGLTAGMSTQGNTSGTTGPVSLQLILVGGNNVTLSQSVNAGSATLTISAFTQSVQTQMTGLTAGISTQGNTSGTTGLVSNQIVFVGGNNITLSQSVNAQSVTLTISAFTQSVQTQMTGLTAGMSTQGNTSGTTGLVSNQLIIVGGNNITLSQSVNAGSATLTISAANETQTVPPIATAVKAVQTSGSTGTITRFAPEDHAHQGVAGIDVQGVASTFFGTYQLSAGNLISIATGGNTSRGSAQIIDLLSSATTVSSVATANAIGAMASRFALEGHQHGGVPTVSVVGNTAGNTTQGNLSLILAGGPNITLSGGSAAGAMTVSVSASGPRTLSVWDNLDLGANSGTGQMTGIASSSGTLWVFPLHPINIGYFPGNMSVSTVLLQMSAASSSNWTVAQTFQLSFGIYTRANATSLNSIFSASTSYTDAATSQSSLVMGIRWLSFNSSQFNAQPTLSQTEYYGALWMNSSGQSRGISVMGARAGHSMNLSGTFGAASNSANSLGDIPWLGFHMTSFTTAMPSGIALSQIGHTGSDLGMAVPHVIFNNYAGAY